MQVAPNFLPLVRINAPEIYADQQFAEWLNSVTANGRKELPGFRTASWHWPGHEPGEESDIFMLVDGPDGSDSDMPKHCWEMILEAVSRAIRNTYPECIVWLTNLDLIGVKNQGFIFEPTRDTGNCAFETISSVHAAENSCETQRLGELTAGFDAESPGSSAQPLHVPLDATNPRALIRSVLTCAARNMIQEEVALRLMHATLEWQMNRCTSATPRTESASTVRRVSQIIGCELQDSVFAIELHPPDDRRIDRLSSFLTVSNKEIWVTTSIEQFEPWNNVATRRRWSERVVVTTIDSFIGQSISFHGGFDAEKSSMALAAIIKNYNRRVIDTAEDPRLRIVLNETG